MGPVIPHSLPKAMQEPDFSGGEWRRHRKIYSSSMLTYLDDTTPNQPCDKDYDISPNNQQKNRDRFLRLSRSNEPTNQAEGRTVLTMHVDTEDVIQRPRLKFEEVVSMNHREKPQGPKDEPRRKESSPVKYNRPVRQPSQGKQMGLLNRSKELARIMFGLLKSLLILVLSFDPLKRLLRFTLSLGLSSLTIYLFSISIKSNCVSSSIVRQVAPICTWPIISMTPLCKDANGNTGGSTASFTTACYWPNFSALTVSMMVDGNASSPSGSVFETLVDTQDKMAPLIEKSGWGTHFALTMARSETAIRDLSDSVSVSDLPGKENIESGLNSLIHSTNEFVELSMKLDPAITNTRIALRTSNKAATNILRIIAKMDRPNTIWSYLFFGGSTSIPQRDIEYLITGLSDLVEELTGLETMAVASKVKLAEMAEYSRAVNRAVGNDNKVITNEKETLVELWYLTAEQKSKLRAYASHRDLLQDVSDLRKSAAQEIDDIKAIVVTLSETVKALRQNAGKTIDATTLNQEGMLNLQKLGLWVEKSQATTDNFEETTENGRQKIQRIIDREVNGQQNPGLPQ